MNYQKIDWEKFDALIEAASDDPGLRELLQYGTPAAKMEALREYGFSFEELVAIHRELEKIIYKGSIPWWFW